MGSKQGAGELELYISWRTHGARQEAFSQALIVKGWRLDSKVRILAPQPVISIT